MSTDKLKIKIFDRLMMFKARLDRNLDHEVQMVSLAVGLIVRCLLLIRGKIYSRQTSLPTQHDNIR